MPRNPWIAAALSFLVTGAGQVYVGQFLKGALMFSASAMAGYSYYTFGDPTTGFLGVLVSAYSIWDAYYFAKRPAQPVEIRPEPAQPQLRVF